MRTFTRVLLIIAGTVSLGLGVVGIAIPLLPTTPFLLLAAACYVRGSTRLYDWLLNSKYLGSYIRNYREKRAIPLRTKVGALLLLWASIGYSALFAVSIAWVRMLLLLIAVGVTIHICKLNTLAAEVKADDNVVKSN